MIIRECLPGEIKDLKAIAANKSRWNNPKSVYNPSATKFSILSDEGKVLGYIQCVETLHVEEFFLDQQLPLRDRMEVFRWSVKEFLNTLKQINKKAWWLTKKEHLFANAIYNDNNAKPVNYRKLKVWVYE